jgi:hypothetical protein
VRNAAVTCVGSGSTRRPLADFGPFSTTTMPSLVFDLPGRAPRSGLKMGLGCPLTSLFLDRVEVVH